MRALLRVWLPTVAGALTLVVEIPVVAAAAARSTDGGRALAAVGIGMSILVVVNTPALAMTPLVASEYGRRPPRVLRRHTAVVGVVGSAVLVAFALPPGSYAVRGLFGLDAGLSAAVSAFLAGLAANPFAVALRRHLHGRLIHAAHTAPITWANLARIATTGTLAWTGVAVWPGHGPLVAGLALTAGACLEAAALAPTVPSSRPIRAAVGGTWRGLAAHHGHLSAARLLTMLPTVVTTVAVAHAAKAPESLVVWPVLIQLVALFTSPTTDWESVTASALRRDARSPAPGRLTAWCGAALTASLILAYGTGLAGAFVRDLLAVPDAAADLGLAWLWPLLPLPWLWIARGYLRGVVMAAGGARWLSYASLAHAAVLVTVAAALTSTALPGVGCAALALVAGVLTDTLVTAHAARNGRPVALAPA